MENKPNTIVKPDDFTWDLSIFDSFRHWLIKKIAGDYVIIMNASLSYVERDDDTHELSIEDVEGLLCSHNRFHRYGNKILKISQVKK